MTIYISAVYWAITSCATVGYGDIVSSNDYENITAILILIVGVAIFSFALSDLSNQFSELNRNSSIFNEREKQLKELEKKFKVGKNLTDRIQAFFNQKQNKLDYAGNSEMSFLMRVLPSNLKTRMIVYLYREAIQAIKFI